MAHAATDDGSEPRPASQAVRCRIRLFARSRGADPAGAAARPAGGAPGAVLARAAHARSGPRRRSVTSST